MILLEVQLIGKYIGSIIDVTPSPSRGTLTYADETSKRVDELTNELNELNELNEPINQ